MNQPPEIQISPFTMLAALMFSARHRAYAPVPENPGVVKEVDRIILESDPEAGEAIAVLDPMLLLHFAKNNYGFSFDRVQVPGGLAPNDSMYRLAFKQMGVAGLVLANGQAAPGDPLVGKALKQILG